MRKGVWYGLLTGLALLLAACGGGGQPQPDLTLAYVLQVSGDGSVLGGRALVSGAIRPMVWRLNAASLSPGFHWLSYLPKRTVPGHGRRPVRVQGGLLPTARWAAASVACLPERLRGTGPWPGT
jgi:hypothetical protein